MEQILGDIEEIVVSRKWEKKFIVPNGFYVFRYKAQWAAGGYDDDEITRMDVVKADSQK